MKIIPKQKRIKIYKRALQVLENEEEDWDAGLCILLRDLYYGFRASSIHRFELTPARFPEFNKYYKYNNWEKDDSIKFEKTYYKNEHLWRRVVLRLILEELKANEEI
jgi:hypothetical protein